jgi:proteasome lid subunit RPN8/RPN11
MTRIPRPVANQILTHAQRSPEAEVCGLVSIDRDGLARTYPVANVAEHPGALFQMDPKGQIEALRRIRVGGESLFAIYHSHPHGPALPSERDLQEAAYREALYLIVSLDTRGVLEMRGFRLSGQGVEAVGLEVS